MSRGEEGLESPGGLEALVTSEVAEPVREESVIVATSRELRTPVMSILGYTELLLEHYESVLDSGALQFVDAIRRNAEQVKAMSEDLLALSELDAGDSSSTPLTDATQIVMGVQRVVAARIGAGSLTVTFGIPHVPVHVSVDAGSLERLVANLVDNAVTYTRPGGSVVCLLEERLDEVVIEVRDTGVGIAAEEQQLVFTPFFRGSAARQISAAGSGLGLSIASTIVEKHGGTLEVSSALGHGSTFTVSLPRVCVADDAHAEAV